MTEVNTILKRLAELERPAREASTDPALERTWRDCMTARADALKEAADIIIEQMHQVPVTITNPDEPPWPANIWIEIPIASIRNVSFEREVGPTITFNPRDPRNWEPGVISVPYETATKAMAMLK